MKNLLDKNDFRFVDLEFLSKSGLRTALLGEDRDGELTLRYLERLVNSELPLIKEMCLLYADVRIAHPQASNIIENNSLLRKSEIIWGRMIVTFYYFYHKNQAFAKKICDQMLERSTSKLVNSSIELGMASVDNYFKREKEYNEILNAEPAEHDDTRERELEMIIEQKDAQIHALKEQINELQKQQNEIQQVKAGRPKRTLFNDAKLEDEQSRKVVELLKKHKLYLKPVNCQKDNIITKYLASIYWAWQEAGLIPREPVMASAFSSFLKNKCNLQFEVTEKAYANLLGETLAQRIKDPDIWYAVLEIFPIIK